MAGVLVSNCFSNRRQRANQPQSANELGRVSYERTEALGLVAICLVIPQQIVIFLHRRAAAGGIHDDCVEAAGQKCIDVLPGHLLCRYGFSVMKVESTAAGLILRESNSAPV